MAIFGSVMLTIYNRDFAGGVPAGTPPTSLKPFGNPMLLEQIRPQLEASFGRYPGGTKLLDVLLADVRTSLIHGLQVIFFVGAVIMTAAVVVNLLLREVPIRGGAAPAVE